MSDPKRPSISDTEMDVLRVLWELGRGTVREIHALLKQQGKSWAYTTALTLLQRLEAKQYVSSDKSGMAHVFKPEVTKQSLLKLRLTDLANQLCEGTSTPLVLALVENQNFSAADLQRFRSLLDELETKASDGSED